MLFTFKTVALAVLAVVAVGNVQVQGAPLPSSSSTTTSPLSVESSVEAQTQGSVHAIVKSDNLDSQSSVVVSSSSSSSASSASSSSSSSTTKETGVKKTYSRRRIARRHP